MSFKTFLGLETGDKIPDEKTVWNFRVYPKRIRRE